MASLSYSAVGVQELFIFSDLKINPSRLGIAIAMPLCKNILRLLTLVVDE
jgi:hypothetical protein